MYCVTDSRLWPFGFGFCFPTHEHAFLVPNKIASATLCVILIISSPFAPSHIAFNVLFLWVAFITVQSIIRQVRCMEFERHHRDLFRPLNIRLGILARDGQLPFRMCTAMDFQPGTPHPGSLAMRKMSGPDTPYPRGPGAI